MVVVPMVDRPYGTPISCATEATARSPSVCIIRVKPVGAKTNGRAARLPRMSRLVSTRGHVAQHRRAELDPGERLPGAAERVLAVGGAVAVVEHRARRAPARDQPQVGDRGGAAQPSGRGVPDERGGAQQRGELGGTGQATLDHARQRKPIRPASAGSGEGSARDALAGDARIRGRRWRPGRRGSGAAGQLERGHRARARHPERLDPGVHGDRQQPGEQRPHRGGQAVRLVPQHERDPRGQVRP